MQQRLSEFSSYSYVYSSIYVTLKIATLVALCKNIYFASRENRADPSFVYDNRINISPLNQLASEIPSSVAQTFTVLYVLKKPTQFCIAFLLRSIVIIV